MKNDGIIEGDFEAGRTDCDACGENTGVTIKIKKITLPEGIKPGKTLIAFKGPKAHKVIGISCGCYAKFHRQIAHIEDKVKK